MKQVQEAYIVAATRTPIGRSHRGYFRNTRPDDLLVAAIKQRHAAGAHAGPQGDRGFHHWLLVPRGRAGPEHGPHCRGPGL